MEKRQKISANITFRKYLLSWLILVLAYIITNAFNLNRVWDYVTWTIALLIFIVFIALKKVEFSQSAVYFDNKRVAYASIMGLKTFEIQHQPYYLFITDAKNPLKKYYLTQLGGISFLSVFKILFSKKTASALPLAEFLNLLDEKSNIQ